MAAIDGPQDAPVGGTGGGTAILGLETWVVYGRLRGPGLVETRSPAIKPWTRGEATSITTSDSPPPLSSNHIQVLDMLSQLLLAIQSVHSKGILHRCGSEGHSKGLEYPDP